MHPLLTNKDKMEGH